MEVTKSTLYKEHENYHSFQNTQTTTFNVPHSSRFTQHILHYKLMEDHPNYILDWSYLYKQKNTEELTQTLWSTTMELEATKIKVQEDIKAKDDELNQLKNLLNEVINERNEAQNKYKSLLLEKSLIKTGEVFPVQVIRKERVFTPAPPHSNISSIEDEPITNHGFSSSDCEESIVSSPPAPEKFEFPAKGLPENGKFLEAVMKAGPLLNNLLLAGQLPHWRHPPPPLNSHQIPSPPLVVPPPPASYVLNCGEFSKKRVFYEDCDSSSETKYQRIS